MKRIKMHESLAIYNCAILFPLTLHATQRYRRSCRRGMGNGIFTAYWNTSKSSSCDQHSSKYRLQFTASHII